MGSSRSLNPLTSQPGLVARAGATRGAHAQAAAGRILDPSVVDAGRQTPARLAILQARIPGRMPHDFASRAPDELCRGRDDGGWHRARGPPEKTMPTRSICCRRCPRHTVTLPFLDAARSHSRGDTSTMSQLERQRLLYERWQRAATRIEPRRHRLLGRPRPVPTPSSRPRQPFRRSRREDCGILARVYELQNAT